MPTGDDFIETYSVSDLVSEGYTGIPDYIGPVKDDHSETVPDGPVKPDE
jgi:hypothetical protein